MASSRSIPIGAKIRWRPFVETFDSRGVKPLVSVVFSFIIVTTFHLDVMTQIVNIYENTMQPASFAGELLTALILGGGSSGVNNIMVAIGVRQASDAKPPAPRPPPDKAWFAVRLHRGKARGPVMVRIGSGDAATIPIVGAVTGSPRIGGRLAAFFLRDLGRFPPSGGHAVDPGTYTVLVSGVDPGGNPIAGGAASKWGPFSVAAGALIDLDLSI